MIGFLGPFAPFVAGALAALCLSNVLFYNLWQGAKDDIKTAEATLSAERVQNKLDSDQAKLEADRVNLDISNRWSDAVTHLHNNPRIRVLPCADGGVQDGNAGASGGLNPPVSTPGFDTITITPAQCQKRLNDGVKDAVDYEWISFWVTKQLEKNPK